MLRLALKVHPQDCYVAAVKEAQNKVKEKYGLNHHEYTNEHEAHNYWLECFERAFSRLILKGE